MGEGEAMLFGEYIRLMALVENTADEIETVFSDFKNHEVCVYAAPTPDGDRRAARRGGRNHRPRRIGGQVRPQVPDQGRQPHLADGPLLVNWPRNCKASNRIRCRSPTTRRCTRQPHSAGADPIHDVDYWKKGLRHSVYFTHGIRNAVDNGHTTFLELAPTGRADAGRPHHGRCGNCMMRN